MSIYYLCHVTGYFLICDPPSDCSSENSDVELRDFSPPSSPLPITPPPPPDIHLGLPPHPRGLPSSDEEVEDSEDVTLEADGERPSSALSLFSASSESSSNSLLDSPTESENDYVNEMLTAKTSTQNTTRPEFVNYL